MNLSRGKLLAEAAATRFRPDTLEKALRLLSLLMEQKSHPFLKHKLALKGGTALNLFVFNVPRLSVDIDLNYIGPPDREAMLKERPLVERAISDVCKREGFTLRHVPDEHAGGKWYLRYKSALGHSENLELDLNFMFRVPLLPPVTTDSHPIGSYQGTQVCLLDLHELAAGKLAALLSRRASRDLFDVHQLLTSASFNREALRICFLIYGAMNRKNWGTVSANDVSFQVNELEKFLLPLLRQEVVNSVGLAEAWANSLLSECRERLSIILPLEEHEREFLTRLLDHGEIKPSLLTEDEKLAAKLETHPGLLWKALNVQKFKRR
ncbi:MAG: nucleotidyl transferase AbiEii/AbiGii toxin family protein [Deltaproteobacteria bacterium]|nr:nucleotidyl transferase AbiEii/AbiGii toxin family protein [Deltaproteobacteria bacterium]